MLEVVDSRICEGALEFLHVRCQRRIQADHVVIEQQRQGGQVLSKSAHALAQTLARGLFTAVGP